MKRVWEKLDFARDRWFLAGKPGYQAFMAEFCVTRHGMTPEPHDWIPLGDPLVAWVNQGIWSVTCPHCQENVVADVGQAFICPGCLNSYQSHRARPVQFPHADKMRALEHILCSRPRENRNWRPEETLQLLQAENDLHGIGA